MSHPTRQPRSIAGRMRLWALIVALLAGALVTVSTRSSLAAPSDYRIDLEVLLFDDNSPWVDAIEWQMIVEGVPYTAVALAGPRPVITDAFLSSGDRAFYQAIVLPSYSPTELSAAELAIIRSYEAKFGIREVAAYNYANPAVGLNAPPIGIDPAGTSASVTAAGRARGFGYLNGPVPFGAGSYSYITEPLTAAQLPPGASFTTLIDYPLANGARGSVIGVYTNGGVEQLVITSAFNFTQPQFKLVSHGIISWMTRGVHFGYNRNNLTFHVDDAFASTALWDSQRNCTPGRDGDCPLNPDGTSSQEIAVRMTAADVVFAADWQRANNYQLTLAFNAAYANPINDPLTQSFQTNKASFRWLNHGFEHIYQGCVQNFTVSPWQCSVDANGAVVWESQTAVYAEIQRNIDAGIGLGLPFDRTEYLSGEHSGLVNAPRQMLDNPNFVAALTQAGVRFIGSDASRESAARQVGTALTIPRHPTALYYNTATRAQAVDEYNYLYNSRANGGSGYCEDNPFVATCIAPLGADGFTSYIVPTDTAFNLNFILGNDPRPLYAHTSNMTGDRLIFTWLDAALGYYRAAFTSATPVMNLTLTEASTALRRQNAWTANLPGGAPVTGYVLRNQLFVDNAAGVEAPITAPTGTVINGGPALRSYGGEVSGWLAPGAATLNLPVPNTSPAITSAATATAVTGLPFSFTVTTSGSPVPTVSRTGALPTGITFVANTNGTATFSGIATTAMAGRTFPITLTATNVMGAVSQSFSIVVGARPVITSATTRNVKDGVSFTFTVTTTGSPTATLSATGALPLGVTFTPNADGTATLSGTPPRGLKGSYVLTITATNVHGSATQSFTLKV